MDAIWYEKIEAYRNGTLSRAERSQFEAALATNNELASAFAVYQAIEQEMQSSENHNANEAALRKTLQELNARYFNAPSVSEGVAPVQTPETASPLPSQAVVKRMPVWARYAIAACVLGIVVLGVLQYQRQTPHQTEIAAGNEPDDTSRVTTRQDTSVQQHTNTTLNENSQTVAEERKSKETQHLTAAKRTALFAANFKPDAAPNDREGPLEDAFAAYEAQQYQEASTAFENADVDVVTRGEDAEQKRNQFYAHYYQALSYMAAGATAKAIPQLTKALPQSPDAISNAKVQWYLALAQLKAGESEKAAVLLARLAQRSTVPVYQEQAKALLKEIESN